MLAVLAGCSNQPTPGSASGATPATPTANSGPAPAPATPTTGLVPPGVPVDGTRPDSSRLPQAAEPESAGPPSVPPAGRQVAVGPAPEGVVVDPVTRTVAVAKRGPNEIVLLDADTGQVRSRTPLPGFVRHLQLAGPGGPVLVPVESANSLLRVALPDGRVESQVITGTSPHDATQAPNGTVFVADELGGTVAVLRGTQLVKVFADSVQPAGMAPVGTTVGMLDVRENSLTTYDAAGLTRIGETPAGAGPTHLVADRHGRMIATDTRGNAVLVFTPTPQPQQVARIAQPGGPYGIAYDAVRDRLWVASSGTNEVVGYDMTAPQPREVLRLPTVQDPYTVGVDPQTGRLFVAGVATGMVQIIDPGV